MEMPKLMSKQERAQVVLALHKWMDSQEIKEVDRGPIFAWAAGLEVGIRLKANPLLDELGLVVLKQYMELGAKDGAK